jgi:hypothetical protein
MIDDLVKCLHEEAERGNYICAFAAKRIEALETALWIISHAKRDPCDKHCGFFLDLQQIAKDALMEGKND